MYKMINTKTELKKDLSKLENKRLVAHYAYAIVLYSYSNVNFWFKLQFFIKTRPPQQMVNLPQQNKDTTANGKLKLFQKKRDFYNHY